MPVDIWHWKGIFFFFFRKGILQWVSVVRKTAPTQMPSSSPHCKMKCLKKDRIVCFPGLDKISKALKFSRGRPRADIIKVEKKNRPTLLLSLRRQTKSFRNLPAMFGPRSGREDCYRFGMKELASRTPPTPHPNPWQHRDELGRRTDQQNLGGRGKTDLGKREQQEEQKDLRKYHTEHLQGSRPPGKSYSQPCAS